MLRFRLSAKACSLGGSSSSPRNSLRSSFAGAPVYHEQSRLCSVSRKSGNFTRLLAPPFPQRTLSTSFRSSAPGTPISNRRPRYFPCPARYTSSTEMSAGDTPDIRVAWPASSHSPLCSVSRKSGNFTRLLAPPLPQPTRFARVVRGPLFQTVGRAIFPVRPDIPAAPRCPPEIRPISASLGRRFGGGYRLASPALQGAGR